MTIKAVPSFTLSYLPCSVFYDIEARKEKEENEKE